MRQEYFAVYREYADLHKTEAISTNFLPKPNISEPKSRVLRHYRMGKKTISLYYPFKYYGIFI